jgi:hypothetical protein
MRMQIVTVIFALCALGSAATCPAAEQQTFATPSKAVKALIVAAQSHDQDALLVIFGDDGKDLIASGDTVQDNTALDNFVKSYKTKHVIVTQDADTRLLRVGSKNWELPIPIVRQGDNWRFDTAAGKQELIYRRIGDNELGAIAACRGFIAAQNDYAQLGHDGLPAGIFAQKLASDPGKQNGLYWETKNDEPPSPAGPYLAKAADEGYKGSDPHDPYHGYFYRSVKAQGAAAEGGAKSYLVDGQLKDGVALVAYPATYKSSGVMTFIINQRGVVYQKDLGANTAALAEAITEFNPDSSWKEVAD